VCLEEREREREREGMVFTRPGGSFVSMKESNFQVMVAHGYDGTINTTSICTATFITRQNQWQTTALNK